MLLIIILIELLTYNHFVNKEEYKELTDQINAKQPDIIMLGNSILGHNVDKRIFDKELSNLTGKNITSIFWSSNGAHSAWWYLSIKNQILPSNVSRIPIGIIYRLDFLTRPKWGITGKNEKKIRKLMIGKEPTFFEKIKDNYKIEKFYKTFFFREELSHSIKLKWIKVLLYYYDKKVEKIYPDELLNNKFDLKNLRTQKQSFIQTSKETEEDHYIRLNNHVAHINASFLPNMINLMENNTFFVVETHLNPEIVNEKHLWTYNTITYEHMAIYRKSLQNYLNKKKVEYMPLHNWSELDDPKLYRDGIHFNENGSIIFTKKLAYEIYKRELVK